jgi:23S rRNA (uracil1939-C5)-methyltransferase
VDALLAGGDWTGADELTLRLGAATGERLVVVSPAADEIDLPADAGDVHVIGTDQLRAGARAWFHDEVAGHRFRISAHSFFQSRTDGAEALVAAVRELGGHELASARTVIDAYGGVGLFGVAATPLDARVVLVESGHSSAVDAKHNLEGRDAKVIRTPVERWRPSPADVVIADPARTGLAKEGAKVVAGTHAPVVVLVSCDAASLGRDARLLTDAGYALERSMLVDLFPHTHHVEVVSRFVRP